jgi:hypothetical protein
MMKSGLASLKATLKDKPDATRPDHRSSNWQHCSAGAGATASCAAGILRTGITLTTGTVPTTGITLTTGTVPTTGTRLSVIGFRPRACLSEIGFAHGFQSYELGRPSA